MTTVAVAGASGYAGGELLRYLAQHPTFDLIAACAAGRAGARARRRGRDARRPAHGRGRARRALRRGGLRGLRGAPRRLCHGRVAAGGRRAGGV